MSDLTVILQSIEDGNPQTAERLLPLVYSELRALAQAKMARERSATTLQATALVHEAWLKLVGAEQQVWRNRQHFFAAAAETMRRILIDRARRRMTRERAGFAELEDEWESKLIVAAPSEEIMAVHEALDRLAVEEATAAELVKLRYFVGMTMDEASEALGMPLRKTERLWAYARAWLRGNMPDHSK